MVSEIMEKVGDGPKTIVIDLGYVTYMNNYVLQPFLQLWLKTNQSGCRIGLACVKGHILELIQKLGITEHFRLFDSPHQAFQKLNE